MVSRRPQRNGHGGEIRTLVSTGLRSLVPAWLLTCDVSFARYPVFIDVAIQGASKGFLGTFGSTLSLLSLRRAQDWNDGLGKLIMWNQFGEHPEAVEA